MVGTLGAVVVTATAGLLTAMLTTRQQRETLERQLKQETNSKIREERRAVFVDYLKAYDAAMGQAFKVMISHDSMTLTQTDPPRPFETVANAEVASVNQAYLTLTITASNSETREAADECNDTLWRIGKAAMSGNKESFDQEVEGAREPRRRLRAAMRKELGME